MESSNKNSNPRGWTIGDRVRILIVSLAGFREMYTGTITSFLHNDQSVVKWDGNKIGAVQVIPNRRLLRISW